MIVAFTAGVVVGAALSIVVFALLMIYAWRRLRRAAFSAQALRDAAARSTSGGV
jgi:hypothetical protein